MALPTEKSFSVVLSADKLQSTKNKTHPLGLDGHSDADVLCHTLYGAILCARGAGDLGKIFPF